MAGVGIGVHPPLTGRRGHDDLANLVRDLDAAQGLIAAGDTLGKGHDIRFHPPAVEGKPFTRAAKAGDHFVGDEEYFVLVTDGADGGEVVVRRDDDAARALDRLGDECADGFRTFGQDGFFQ